MSRTSKFSLFLILISNLYLAYSVHYIKIETEFTKQYIVKSLNPDSELVKSIEANISRNILLLNKKHLDDQFNDLKKIVREAEDNYGMYTEEYINLLMKKASKNIEILYPHNSLAEIANNRMEAFLEEEDRKNYERGVNLGIIKAKERTILIERLKGLHTDKTDAEINQILEKMVDFVEAEKEK